MEEVTCFFVCIFDLSVTCAADLLRQQHYPIPPPKNKVYYGFIKPCTKPEDHAHVKNSR